LEEEFTDIIQLANEERLAEERKITEQEEKRLKA